MINQIYIDKAIDIRKRYLKIHSELLDKNSELLELNNKATSLISNLEKIEKGLKTGFYKDKESFQKDFNENTLKIEVEINKIKNIYSKLDEKKKELESEHESLYNSIKTKYPTLDDATIVKEISDAIVDLG